MNTIDQFARANGKIATLRHIRSQGKDCGLKFAQAVYAESVSAETLAILSYSSQARRQLESAAREMGIPFNFYANATAADLEAAIHQKGAGRAS